MLDYLLVLPHSYSKSFTQYTVQSGRSCKSHSCIDDASQPRVIPGRPSTTPSPITSMSYITMIPSIHSSRPSQQPPNPPIRSLRLRRPDGQLGRILDLQHRYGRHRQKLVQYRRYRQVSSIGKISVEDVPKVWCTWGIP